MSIASNLRADDVNVLILTGSPIAGRFTLPENVDFVRIPGMIKKTNDEYRSLSIRINPDHALNIRKSIILATAQTFEPDLFIVDKEPLGLKKEVLPTLQWLKQNSPGTRSVLGLRDIMDDADVVRRDWHHKDVYRHLKDLYSEIWVYGRQDVYDAVSEYGIPESVQVKTFFTGYLPRRGVSATVAAKTRKKFGVRTGQKMLVLTTGGGGDGFKMMDVYLEMLEQEPLDEVRSVLVTGPFMPMEQRRELTRRARPLGIKIRPFYPCMEELFAAADLVVSMGGYNTVCEILSQGTVSLIIPRDRPRKEQLLRARALKSRGIVDCISWQELDRKKLRQKITAILDDLDRYRLPMQGFCLDGIGFIKKRLQEFRRNGTLARLS
jgi:predicted glycosyltransferase